MTVLITILFIVIKIVSIKLKPVDKSNILMEDQDEKLEIPVAFYLAVSNFIVILVQVIKMIVW